jgi:hypothetical protein
MTDQPIPPEDMLQGPEPSEEELRAALEEEMKRVHAGDIVLQSVVSLINIGMRRTGLAPGTESERDLGQVALAANSVAALLPSVEAVAPEQLPAVRDALSQLQLAFVKAGGQTVPEAASGDADPSGVTVGEAEKPASRIWVPPGT